MIKFGDIELPLHPFIWDYDEDILYPIIKSKKMNSFEDLKFNNSRLQTILKLISAYDIEYYCVKQTIFKETKISYVSFHSWYFSQISNKTNMTRCKFNVTVMTGLYAEKDEKTIFENNIKHRVGLTINGMSKNDVYVHNTKLSPCYDNSFVLNMADAKDDKKIILVTVIICNKIKKCCVTKHILVPA